MADQVGELDLFLAVAKDCGIVVYLNQSQQSTSPCFGQSANHGVCRPYALASAGGYHLRRRLVLDWIGLSSVLRPRHQHSIGYMGDGFYRSKDPTNSIKVLKVHIVQITQKYTIIKQ